MLGRVSGRNAFAAFRSSRLRGSAAGVRVTFVASTSTLSAAFAINKKYGNAVDRNLARRRLRSVIYENRDLLPVGSYLISLAPSAAQLDFPQLKAAALRACRAAAS